MPLSQLRESGGDAHQRAILLDDLGRELLKALIEDFRLHGAAAIAELRAKDAKTYLAMLARLVPATGEREASGGVMVTTTIDLGGVDG